MTETRVRRGAGWWPTLVLWGTVIAVGALYLASVEHHRREAQDQDRALPRRSCPLSLAYPPHLRSAGPIQAQATSAVQVGELASAPEARIATWPPSVLPAARSRPTRAMASVPAIDARSNVAAAARVRAAVAATDVAPPPGLWRPPALRRRPR